MHVSFDFQLMKGARFAYFRTRHCSQEVGRRLRLLSLNVAACLPAGYMTRQVLWPYKHYCISIQKFCSTFEQRLTDAYISVWLEVVAERCGIADGSAVESGHPSVWLYRNRQVFQYLSRISSFWLSDKITI